jgi:hypothetical protein
VLDDDGGGVARVIVGGEADEEAVGAVSPRHAHGVEILGLFGGAVVMDLGGAGFAGHLDVGQHDAGVPGGAGLGVDDLEQALADEGEVAVIDIEGGPVGGVGAELQGAADAAGDVRADGEAAGNAGDHGGERHGGDFRVALADALHHRIAGGPMDVPGARPVQRGDQAGRGVREIHAEIDADAELAGHGGDVVLSHAEGDLIEEDVAADL